ncbi:MAG: response regulator transcription factor [Aquincola sp.]|nr:response regulator transcription factor [Betaproteobacteria bacterium]MDH4289985.1 response regulator transcription factor [Aquincola sp.]MDH5210429.1 response regulator transcription factor [Betaproteobacteria bacterium]
MKILIADDHALFREGMRHVLLRLGEGVEVIEAGNFDQLMSAVGANPDLALVLLDLHMPGPGKFAALQALAERYPALPVVVLSGSEERTDMQRALAGGAMGFIPKAATAPVMLSALRLVLSGGVYVPPEMVQAHGVGEGAAGSEALLTPRQIEVLARVIEGKPNKIIASDLGLSEATVKAHVTAVFRALNVSNRTQAARAAERLGIKLSGPG